jgi:hypothetical protein
MPDLKGKKIDIEGRSTFFHIFVPPALAKWEIQFQDIPAQAKSTQ